MGGVKVTVEYTEVGLVVIVVAVVAAAVVVVAYFLFLMTISSTAKLHLAIKNLTRER